MSNDLQPDAPIAVADTLRNVDFDVDVYATENELDEHEIVLEDLAKRIHYWTHSTHKRRVYVDDDEESDEDESQTVEYQDVDHVQCHFHLDSDAVDNLRSLKAAHAARLVITQNDRGGTPIFQHSFYLDLNELKFHNLFGDRGDKGEAMSWTFQASCIAVELFEIVPQAEV